MDGAFRVYGAWESSRLINNTQPKPSLTAGLFYYAIGANNENYF